jgi:phosphopantothenoylcysteine decarboxylase
VVNGMADNLLTSVVRCWDISPDNPRRPRILVAPGMSRYSFCQTSWGES